MSRIIVGVIVALLFGIFAYATMLLGSYVSSVLGSEILGFIAGIPGIIFILPTVPFIFLIDVFPMGKVFPQGGASGIFGSLLIFGFIIWSFIFGILAYYRKWPFAKLK